MAGPDGDNGGGLVGWAKRSVPTIFIHHGKMVGTALPRLCPPYES